LAERLTASKSGGRLAGGEDRLLLEGTGFYYPDGW